MAAPKRGSVITLFNPTQMPIVYSEDGRTVGGGERVEVDVIDEVAQTSIKHGYLVDETGRKSEQKSEATSATSNKDGAPDQNQPA